MSRHVATTSAQKLLISTLRFEPVRLSPVGVALVAFLIDLKTPHGMIDGYLYTLAVLACMWILAPNAALYTALGSMIPMGIGFAASPDGAALEVAFPNLLVSILVIWLTAIVVWHNTGLIRERGHAAARATQLNSA